MKQIGVVLLLIAICCSACSSPSSNVGQDASGNPLMSSDQSVENDSAVFLTENDREELSLFSAQEETSMEPGSSDASDQQDSTQEHNDDPSSFSVQEDTSVEPASSATPDYQGFTQKQWSELQLQKEEYGNLSAEERGIAAFNAEIDCTEFIHLRWEHDIDIILIRQVGANEFESWFKEFNSINNADHCDIYRFSIQFSITLDELVTHIETNGLTQHYDLETVKRRYAYFIGDSQE